MSILYPYSEAIVSQVLDELGVEIGDQVIIGGGAHIVISDLIHSWWD